VPLFAQGDVFAPDKTWAQDVIDETLAFPKGRHDDWVDTVSSAFIYMRDNDKFLLRFEEEQKRDRRDRLQYLSAASPCPPVVADGCADRLADGVSRRSCPSAPRRGNELRFGRGCVQSRRGGMGRRARHAMKGWPT
jgi:hypothetical protein